MKIINNLRFKYRLFRYEKLSVMAFRNNGRPLVEIIIRLIPAMGGNVSPNSVSIIKLFLKRASKIHSTQGLPGVVKFLKVVAVRTQQSIAGQTTSQLTPRISTTRGGLPRIYPVPLRNLIRKGNTFYIRLSLTLASLYRDFLYISPTKVDTITKPFGGKKQSLRGLVPYIKPFVKCFVTRNYSPLEVKTKLLKRITFFHISKSSPQSFGLISSNPLTVVRSALNMPDSLHAAIYRLSRPLVRDYGRDPFVYIKWIKESTSLSMLPKGKHNYISKLGLKQEAAGKVRVFAMVDPWTQWVLRPYHQALFSILRRHRMDGTFDQLRPLDFVPWGRPIYSMDLSAATDRLPLELQVPLFGEIFSLNKSESNAWGSLMADRDYLLPSKKGEPLKTVRYSVGQPMGALSSWAMLAITHHFIVHVAAWRAHKVPVGRLYRQYAVLGDDIVIFDKDVSKSYHKIMLSLGVECNLNKSVLSPSGDGLEFAKKTFYKGINVSPTPLKELYSALQNPAALLSYKNKYNLSFPAILRVAGFGYKVVSRHQQSIYKQNLKIKFLYLTEALQNGQALNVLVQIFFPHLLGQKFYLTFKRYFIHEYEKYAQKFTKTHAGIDKLRLDKELYPGKVLQTMYDIVYQPYKVKVSVAYSKAIQDLRTVFSGMKFSQITSDNIASRLESLFQINKEVSNVSLDTLLMKSTKSERPAVLKAETLHQTMLMMLKPLTPALKSVPKVSGPSEVPRPVAMVDQPGQYRASSFNLFALLPTRRLLLISHRLVTGRVLKLFLLRRLIWTASLTCLLGILSYLTSVKLVLSTVIIIWTAIQNLFIIDSGSPANPILSCIGNVILHSVELYIAAVILAVGINWPQVWLFLGTNLEVYQEGGITLLQFVINPFIYMNALVTDSMSLAVQHRDLIYSWITPTPGISFYNFSFGVILFWVVKWFFFGL